MLSQKQLQALTQFSEFVLLLKNPDELLKHIEEAKRENDRLEQMLGPKTIVEEALKYKADKVVEGDKIVQDLHNEVLAFAKEKQRKEDEFREKEEQFNAQYLRALADQESFAETEKAFLAKALKVKEREEAVVVAEARLAALEESLKTREQELAEKSRKIAELVG